MTEVTGPQDLLALWSSEQWLADTDAWIHEAALTVGARVSGPIETTHHRFWAVVRRVSTDQGVMWFKENAPSQSFEAALVRTIDQVAPGQVAPVVATDDVRGWLLTRDLGSPLAEDPALQSDSAAGVALAELAGSYAGLQRTLEGRARDMWAAGVPSFDYGNAMAYAVALADQLAGLPMEDGRRLDADGRRMVDAGLSRLGEAAARLEVDGIPESLEHNDLHLWNAFRPAVPARSGFSRLGPSGVVSPEATGLAVIDLGDALWSHPFATLRLLCWNARRRLGSGPGDPAYERIVEAYLDHWSEFGTETDLRRLLPAAERLSCLHRAESWRRLMADVPLSTIPDDYLDAPAYWLQAACSIDPYVWTCEN